MAGTLIPSRVRLAIAVNGEEQFTFEREVPALTVEELEIVVKRIEAAFDEADDEIEEIRTREAKEISE